MSTMNYIATSDELTSVADAIRTKGGTSSPLEFPAGFVSAIEDIPTGGTTVEPKDVNFIDYDGTIVAAYTAQEFAALDALPENPTHEGLTAQGWNWSLSDAKTYVAAYGKLLVGQMYVTDDGKTRVYISIPGAALSPKLRLAVNGSAVVDWGDESATDTLTGSDTTTAITVQHTYAAPGDYVISIDVTGTAAIQGYYHGPTDIAGILVGIDYLYRIKKIEIGDNIESIGYDSFYKSSISSITIPDGISSISGNAFFACGVLESITIPDSVTSIGNNVFQSCYVLKSISIPNGVTSIDSAAFQSCYALESITIPDSVTSIGNNSTFQDCYVLKSASIPGVTSIGSSAFSGCYALESISIHNGVTSIIGSAFNNCQALTSVTIPDSVTSIGNNAFKGCAHVESYHVKPTTPPTLGTTVFGGTDYIIYVPSASLADYQAASNWSTYASQMVGE